MTRHRAGATAAGLALFVLASCWSGTEVSWQRTDNPPGSVARTEAMTAVVGNKLYVFGGFQPSPFGAIARTDVFDPSTGAWTRKADMPKRLTHTATAVDGQFVYFAGGYWGDNPSNFSHQIFGITDVFRYDTVANSYSTAGLPPLPQARASGGLAVLGRNLHFFGGATTGASRPDKGDHWVLNLDNPASGWQPLPAMPNPRTHLAYVTLNGKIYAIGGQHSFDATLVPQNTVNIYDPSLPGWTTGPALPKTLSHIGSSTFVMDGRIIVLGGENGNQVAQNDAYALDPSSGWVQLSNLPRPRYSGNGGVINGTLYLTNGSGSDGSTQDCVNACGSIFRVLFTGTPQ